MSRRRDFEPLKTIAEVAAIARIPTYKMRRRLKRLAQKHGGTWLICDGRQYLVNVSMLHHAHPALFAKRFVTREEVEDVAERVGKVEERIRNVEQRQNAMGSGMRTLRQRLDQSDAERHRETPQAHKGMGARAERA